MFRVRENRALPGIPLLLLRDNWYTELNLGKFVLLDRVFIIFFLLRFTQAGGDVTS